MVNGSSRRFTTKIAAPVDGYAPFGMQEQLISYWFTHGRPAEIVAPPAGVVRIARREITTPTRPIA